jgi:DNA-binding beta-propeller fold protein YncE
VAGPDGTSDATYKLPWAVAFDPGTNRVFVADAGNDDIRSISLDDGSTRHLAGEGGVAGASDGPGSNAHFSGPHGIAVGTADGEPPVFVSDTLNNTLRYIDSDGVVTFAGSLTPGLVDGPCTNARFNGPQGMILDSAGNLYVADTNNNAIRKITAPLTSDCSVSTVAR